MTLSTGSQLNVRIDSKLEGRLDRTGEPVTLINGFLPFQWDGVNFMLGQEKCVFFRWSTGTGKTVAIEGTILARAGTYDMVLYTVKPNNLISAQRKLKEHTGLDAMMLDGTPKQRHKMFLEIDEQIEADEPPIVIMTVEKFREDKEWFKELVYDRRVLLIYDEMPTKFSNRNTVLYRSLAEVLYTSFIVNRKKQKIFYPREGHLRPASLFSVSASAHSTINSPEDTFNQIRMMDPKLAGTVNDFVNMHYGPTDRYGKPLYFLRLDHLADRIAPIVHSADKINDPDIAKQFPERLPPEVEYCALDKNSAKLYKSLFKEYENIGTTSILDFREILAAIGVFQMICNNPRSVLQSAMLREEYEAGLEKFTDSISHLTAGEQQKELREYAKRYKEGSAVALKFANLINDDDRFTDRDAKGECVVSKLLMLRQKLEEHEGKAIVFTSSNAILQPYIEEWFKEWGITYVAYPKGGQDAIDWFREDENVKVFLSTDAGSDSIDLPEASLTIHYEKPWTKAKLVQRENRQDRIDSEQDVLRTLSLTVPHTIEDRKDEIIEKKAGYERALFEKGEDDPEVEGTTKADLLYILTGEQVDTY